ncbi:peptide-methionine (S)-S-oxide reductase [Ligilactobacillus ruminis DPC 6832]|uniref:Peptide methionine sulfoxide reductase MsrA n=2 Tax=Ligilactobacillus ruminis TaxID=1623 RepID=A0A837E027_9LACO|nr:peptide-methionine (S)-S-oxide reductase [Ligilactobacillus ruminis DPC 6832]
MSSGAADKNVEGIDWIVENKKIETAIFAGGCFWCMTKPFDQMPGIISVRSGYTGGDVENPTYEQVKSGTTGHTEAVKIVFDKTIISYEELLEIYWHQTDPTDAAGQFQDRGSNYRPVIFVKNETQRQAAELSLKNLIVSERFKKPIVTKIESACPFYEAEEEHQQFYKKDPKRMEFEESQGRKQFIEENWGI